MIKTTTTTTTCESLLYTYRFCVQRSGRAMIADDMGLGKTLQAIAVMSYYREDWPLLVVCPSSVRMVWAEVSKDYSKRCVSYYRC